MAKELVKLRKYTTLKSAVRRSKPAPIPSNPRVTSSEYNGPALQNPIQDRRFVNLSSAFIQQESRTAASTDNVMAVSCKTFRKVGRMKPQIVVDCDAGLDDAMALYLFLAAESGGEIDILGITCVAGNTNVKNVGINVLRTLQIVERPDIPVYLGAQKPLISTPQWASMPYYGFDGFGDANLPHTPDTTQIKDENAIEFLNRVVNEQRGEITLVCLGPLTNIALATRMYSDFASSVKNIVLMGGNHKGMGNTTAAAEFNFHFDPESAHIVLSSFSCLVTIIPWETSVATNFTREWRMDILGKADTPQMNMLNALEKSLYDKKVNKPAKWNASDSLVPAVLLRPTIVTKSYECHLSVELHGEKTRGQAVVDHLENTKMNVIIIESVDHQKFKDLLVWAAEKESFCK